MKMLFLSFYLLASGILLYCCPGNSNQSLKPLSPVALNAAITIAKATSTADTNLTMFGRGMYPGDDTTFRNLRESGFTTIILSSFYIHDNGDVYSGDDSRMPVIHDGRYTGNKEWLRLVASLKQQPTSVTRIEILLEGRWFGQPPNTFDFIQDWSDGTKTIPAITTGTGTNSTLYKIAKVLKEEIGIDAVCIDDESVYNSLSVVRFGAMINKLNMHLSLCPYTNYKYWKDIIAGSENGIIDAIYVQCYDGGTGNAPGKWKDDLATGLPVYPIFLCRGAFSSCSGSHNSKTPAEIKTEMIQFKKDYPGMTGGAIWQMADVKSYIANKCAIQYPGSGTSNSVKEYLSQLKNSLKESM